MTYKPFGRKIDIPRDTPIGEITMGTCGDPECDCVHFVLFNRGKALARAVISADEARELVEKLRATLYERAAHRD